MFSFLGKSQPPSAPAAMKRAIILKYLFVKGLATFPPDQLAEARESSTEEKNNQVDREMRAIYSQQVEKLRKNGLWNEMLQEERDFMLAGPGEATQQAFLDAIWLAESVTCLLWALGYVSVIPAYDTQCEGELVNQLPLKPVDLLVSEARLLKFSVIQKQRDVAELWHWRSRTRRLQEEGRMPALVDGKLTVSELLALTSTEASKNGDIPQPINGDFPAFGKAYRDLTPDEFSIATSIATERHRALNWLCGYSPGNRWSDTPTDT